MKQLRQMSILVRGHSFCCWSSHFFWLYGWCRMQGKSMHPGRKLRKLRQMAAMWRRMKKIEPPGIWRRMNHPPGK